MPVKIDPLIVEELAALDLVIWEAKHPKIPFYNTKTMKESSREDKTWVHVSLAGPGLSQALGAGPNLRIAVDRAIIHSVIVYHVPGLRGKMLRLERALWDLDRALATARIEREFDDDDIPF